jgi:purine-binding chemotaxis protein CheW
VAVQAVGEAEEQVVVFELGSEQYGVAIGQVREVIRLPAITAVPRAPAHVHGVINLRGRVIPVIDLRARLGLPDDGRRPAARLVVVEVGGVTVGTAVDAVSDVVRVPRSTVEPAGATTLADEPVHVRGVARLDDRRVTLLDLTRIFDPGDRRRAAA